jgi:hypothetical protein
MFSFSKNYLFVYQFATTRESFEVCLPHPEMFTKHRKSLTGAVSV